MTPLLNAKTKILAFLVTKQIISMYKFSGIPLNIYEVLFLAIQGVRTFLFLTICGMLQVEYPGTYRVRKV